MHIIELAKEAGFTVTGSRIESPYIGGSDISQRLADFAALVRVEYEKPLKLAKEALDMARKGIPPGSGMYGEALAAIRETLADHVEQSLTMVADHSGDANKMVYSKPSVFDGVCCGCSKKAADGYALYCVECWEKSNGDPFAASGKPIAEQEPVHEALQIASVALQDIACSSQTESLYWWQLRARKAQKQIAECLTNAATVEPVNADLYSVAGRLALELECLLLDTKDLSVVSKWWDPAHDALEQWRLIKEQAEQEPAPWKHDCAALCMNDVELWIDNCPHCGKPRTAPSEPVKQEPVCKTCEALARTVMMDQTGKA